MNPAIERGILALWLWHRRRRLVRLLGDRLEAVAYAPETPRSPR